MTDLDSIETVPCPQCGEPRPKPKNWTRISLWRRAASKCRQCVDAAQTRHGETRSPIYRAWIGMRFRCKPGASKDPIVVKFYHEKGIRVCEEWDSYEAFRDWSLANGYAAGLTIDRRDNDKGYSPDNCRWVTQADNLRNRSITKLTREKAAEIKRRRLAGEPLKALAREFGVGIGHIHNIAIGVAWADG